MHKSYITIFSAILIIAIGSSAINAPKHISHADGSTIVGYSAGCSCHGSVTTPGGSVTLVGIPDTVVVNQMYALKIIISDAVQSRWGFDMAVGSGKLTSSNPNVGLTGTRNVHHGSSAPVSSTPSYTFDSIFWTAPSAPTGTGTVKFSYAALAANNDGGSGGDHPYKGSFTTHIIAVTPVKLQSFDAIISNGIAKVNWITATELNTDHFEIERSSNGRDFATIGKVNANGSSTTTKSYSYSDDASKLKGTIYYRLKSVDKSGAFSYSAVVSKEVSLISKYITKLYPNPLRVGQDLKFTYHSERAINVVFQLVNVQGRKVSNSNITVSAGNNNLSLYSNGISAGIYHLNVSVDNVIVQSLPVIVEK